MSTPIEALAQEYSRNQRQNNIKSRCELTHHEQCVQDFTAGYEAGAKAASGRVSELGRKLVDFLDQADFATMTDSSKAITLKKQIVFLLESLSGAGKGEGHE